jgi:hypothetical protein
LNRGYNISQLGLAMAALALGGCEPSSRDATAEERAIVRAALADAAWPSGPDQLICVHWESVSSLDFTGYLGATLADRGLTIPQEFNGHTLNAPGFAFSTARTARGYYTRYVTPGFLSRLLWPCAERVEVALVHHDGPVAYVGARRRNAVFEEVSPCPPQMMMRLERVRQRWRVSDVESIRCGPVV